MKMPSENTQQRSPHLHVNRQARAGLLKQPAMAAAAAAVAEGAEVAEGAGPMDADRAMTRSRQPAGCSSSTRSTAPRP